MTDFFEALALMKEEAKELGLERLETKIATMIKDLTELKEKYEHPISEG